MINKFTTIKFWRKNINLFNRLNQNVLFHQAIKKKSKDCTVLNQQNWTRKNRPDFLFSLIQNHTDHEPIDFFEFGVFEGSSILGLANRHDDPNSRFFGFDAFEEGYPENWDQHKQGDYSSSIPKTNDNRIKFVKGKFQDSLDSFLDTFETKNRLIVHMDADLYSSTLFVLTKLDRLFDEKTIITFDEFGYLDKEFLAFYDYTRSFYRDYEIIHHNPSFGRTSIKFKL
tara:strand:- start:308 stop:988 length:681 start_codon:yes stop_codon:yes gene_type:complete